MQYEEFSTLYSKKSFEQINIGTSIFYLKEALESDELLFRRLLYKKLTRYNNVSLTVNYVFVLPLLERAMSYSFGSCYKEGN